MALEEQVPTRAPASPEPPLPTISASLVKKLLEVHWDKAKGAEKPKINPDALKLTAEYLRRFVIEAHQRAQLEVQLENDETLEPEHIERVMVGMMLDF